MSIRQPKYSMEEHAKRGMEIYERVIRPQVEEDNQGRIVAFDVDTGEFELSDDPMEATDRLLTRLPEAQICRLRVGSLAVHRFGGRTLRD